MKEAAKRVPRTEGHVIVETTASLDPELVEAIRRAARLRNDAASFDPAIEEAEGFIAQKAQDDHLDIDEGAVTYIVDGYLCRVSREYVYKIEPAAVQGLREVLGDRFNELVETRTEHLPTEALIRLACNGDKGRKVRTYLSIRCKPARVTILTEAPGGSIALRADGRFEPDRTRA